jgi:hypothetical protein
MTMKELAERCEQATGPDRDIDHAIANLTNYATVGEVLTYTGSIDAAMTLFRPGHFPVIDCDPRHIEVEVQYLTDETDNGLGTLVATGGATIPLALCAAALRAIASQETTR